MPARPKQFVLLHGFTGCPSAWDPVRKLLPERAAAFTPALSGHDRGMAPVKDFISEVDRLAALVREGGWEGSHLCGYSLGGRVALGLLARHKDLFSGATIIAAHPGLPEGSPARTRRAISDERWASVATRVGAQKFLRQWSEQPLFATQKDLPKPSHARSSGSDLAAAMRALSLAYMPDWSRELRNIRIPVQFMAGALDDKYAALARSMAAVTPGARVVIVPGMGHNLTHESPVSVADALQWNGKDLSREQFAAAACA